MQLIFVNRIKSFLEWIKSVFYWARVGIGISPECVGGREACRRFCAASHERQRARMEHPCAVGWPRETRRVKSIFVITVNQPPHANPIISVCFPRVALAPADVSIIETRIHVKHLERILTPCVERVMRCYVVASCICTNQIKVKIGENYYILRKLMQNANIIIA